MTAGQSAQAAWYIAVQLGQVHLQANAAVVYEIQPLMDHSMGQHTSRHGAHTLWHESLVGTNHSKAMLPHRLAHGPQRGADGRGLLIVALPHQLQNKAVVGTLWQLRGARQGLVRSIHKQEPNDLLSTTSAMLRHHPTRVPPTRLQGEDARRRSVLQLLAHRPGRAAPACSAKAEDRVR